MTASDEQAQDYEFDLPDDLIAQEPSEAEGKERSDATWPSCTGTPGRLNTAASVTLASISALRTCWC